MFQVEDAIKAFVADLESLFAGLTDNGYAQFAYFPTSARSAILHAGRTQTRLKVHYKGADRIIEPYALKYMQAKERKPKEYLYVYNCSGGDNPPGWRQFVSENIQSIENTEETFEPRYPVELSKAGELPENPYLFDPNRPQRTPRAERHRQSVGRSFGRPQYIYQCAYCGKQLKKIVQNSELRAHKRPDGYPCAGRRGLYVTTKY